MIVAGSGRDRVDSPPGDDVIRVRDVVRCGPGRGDIAIADRFDVLRDCERIERV